MVSSFKVFLPTEALEMSVCTMDIGVPFCPVVCKATIKSSLLYSFVLFVPSPDPAAVFIA